MPNLGVCLGEKGGKNVASKIPRKKWLWDAGWNHLFSWQEAFAFLLCWPIAQSS
jgi:hypothetical protein